VIEAVAEAFVVGVIEDVVELVVVVVMEGVTEVELEGVIELVAEEPGVGVVDLVVDGVIELDSVTEDVADEVAEGQYLWNPFNVPVIV